uniref:Uncharacterized protein n=1 Tax=Timema douglasi TaxID=61478 RepID=A0A7R8VGC3_TIMDO|nr:unnamed protein product [Timema douglasi]
MYRSGSGGRRGKCFPGQIIILALGWIGRAIQGLESRLDVFRLLTNMQMARKLMDGEYWWMLNELAQSRGGFPGDSSIRKKKITYCNGRDGTASTRFNSVCGYTVVQQVLYAVIKADGAKLANSENNIEVLTAVEWKQAAGIVEVLGPLADATKEISGDSYPTSSMVIPIPLCLKSYLNVFIASKKDGVMFARNLDKALKIRFSFYDSDPIFCPSMLCDPRFRGVLIDDMVAVNTLAIEVKKLSDKSSLEPNVKDEQPSCSSSSSGLWSSGGLGGTRRGGPDVNIKHSGREDNERERERYRLEREREAARGAPERNADRDRDRRRSRSRERERLEREKRRKSRSRSRERKRRRSRERVKEKDPDIEEIERVERPPPRDRDRDRDRKRRRSRSRDRGAERDRERGDRDRKRERRDRDRGGEKGEREKERRPRSEEKDVRIKLEPPDDYPDYSNTNYEENYEESNVKYEQGEENYNEASGEAEPNGRYEADY